ncbi:helix-turn-helix transcriptional regulator [Alkaliphilus pronyensis]|uniref:Helix-turn-helix transcriptional regulator n=1 Tax=Alkaliphilus pronyensis TaxID=1482732 RepID=A0A6I0F991_9FIRM|nr:helix-turn-helix transcriptional regulator [Alkaliphilus pronyensis]KAB3535363.1 helix-turn-helix transcriptional regulator [Alkaliphilus pronyensis]
MVEIELTKRQQRIIEIVKELEPITSEQIASMLSVTRSTLRPDLAILTMSGMLDARPKVGYFFSGKTDINLFSQEMKSIRVSDIMSVPVIVSEETSVYDVIVSLFLEDVGTIFVASKGFLVGVVSRKDLLKATLGGNDINKVPVAMIMTRSPNIVTTIKDDNALTAAVKIIDHEVDSLPVVERIIKDGKECLKAIGKVSKSNITKLLVELCRGGA